MRETIIDLAGLRTTCVGAEGPTSLVVTLLHGFAMRPSDLSPFAHSLGTPGVFLFPEGWLPGHEGRAWWDIDTEERAAARVAGPRDLADRDPPGLEAARSRIGALLREVRVRFTPQRLVLGGFSQGGMLALDTLLATDHRIDALVLLSSSRLAIHTWPPLLRRLAGLPVFLSHGRADGDLAFAGAERLHHTLASAGADVTWVPFDQGHEVPLLVWRQLRKFLSQFIPPELDQTPKP
jgi:phospholipase/carboxylesterase